MPKFPDTITKDLRHMYAYIDKAADAINEDDHSINFIPSTDKIDRHGEIVLPSAVAEGATRKGEFIENPVALACHLHRLSNGMPPAVGSWNVDTLKTQKHQVQMRLYFAVDTTLGLEYWKLYSKRHMRAVSIGFKILDGHEEVKDGKHIYIITKIELYEISCVAIGANPQALIKLKEFYSSNDNGDNFAALEDRTHPLKSTHGEIEQLNRSVEDLKIFVEDTLDEIKSLLIADQGGFAKDLLRDPSDPSANSDDDSLAEKLDQLTLTVTKLANKIKE